MKISKLRNPDKEMLIEALSDALYNEHTKEELDYNVFDLEVKKEKGNYRVSFPNGFVRYFKVVKKLTHIATIQYK